MRVLFVSSGNSADGISPIIKNQGLSLQKQGIELDYFTIEGKGIIGYLSAIPNLRRRIRSYDYDLIHAHYSLSAYIASFSFPKKLVVSLMGSDVQNKMSNKLIIKIFNKFFWDELIVKSVRMYDFLDIKRASIIPNGVDFDKFNQIKKEIAIKKTGWSFLKKHVLFAAHPKRIEKNFELAKVAMNKLHNPNIELHVLENVPNENMNYYYNSADVVLLTSRREGSPNVIKEAMACGIPIVSTDVGDVKQVIGNTNGCYVAKMDSDDISSKIKLALNFNKKTTGKEDIKQLDSNTIAIRIINIYKSILNK